MKRFVISAEGLVKPVADHLTLSISLGGYKYWHWIENVWLVETALPHTARSLYEELLQKVPAAQHAQILVLEISGPETYWGNSSAQCWQWLSRAGWGKPG